MPTDAPFEFDTATAVVPVAGDPADGPAGETHRFDVTVDPGYCVGPKPNGGYLLAMAARAAGSALGAVGSDHRDPLAATAHYLWAPDAGPARITADVLRTGRSASHVRISIAQAERRCVDVTFTMGTLGDQPEAWWSGLDPLVLPPIESCFRIPASAPGAPMTVSIMDRVALHLDPATTGFTRGAPSGRGELRGWLSFVDERPVDPLALLFFLDVFPPATFELAATGWVPTLSLSTYVRARPVPGPLRVRQAAQVVDGGRFDEVCEIWDAADRLVAQSTQLAAIRVPDGVTAPLR